MRCGKAGNKGNVEVSYEWANWNQVYLEVAVINVTKDISSDLPFKKIGVLQGESRRSQQCEVFDMSLDDKVLIRNYLLPYDWERSLS